MIGPNFNVIIYLFTNRYLFRFSCILILTMFYTNTMHANNENIAEFEIAMKSSQ